MIKIENIQVFNLEGAIRGMRFPLQSNNKSDSGMIHRGSHQHFTVDDNGDVWISRIPATSEFRVGEKDFDLMKRLIKAGHDSHSKFMRQILVSMDITAPRSWWIQMDTYKIGTTSNSESTMHTIHKRPFVLEDFSVERSAPYSHFGMIPLLKILNENRELFLETKEKIYWQVIIDLLPQSYNQKRHFICNFQVLRNIYLSRKNHKNRDWDDFLAALQKGLPSNCRGLVFI